MVGCRTRGCPGAPAPHSTPCSCGDLRARDLRTRRQPGNVAPLCIAAVALLAAPPRVSAFTLQFPTSGKGIWQPSTPAALMRRRTLQNQFGGVPPTAHLRADDGQREADRVGPGLRAAAERPSTILGWSSLAAGGRWGVRSRRGCARGDAVGLRSSMVEDAGGWEWEAQESPPYHS